MNAPLPPTTGSIAEHIAGQIDADLANYPGDQAKYSRLTKLFNIWTQRRAQFFAAAESETELPRLFYYGSHLGWMDATDFILVFGLIDARKTALEQQPERAS